MAAHNRIRASDRRFALPRLGVFAATAVLALVGGLFVAAPASAADMGALTISKTANGQESLTLDPGDEFLYTISVGCDDNDCVDAALTDPLPAEFAGFTILGTSSTPSSQPIDISYAGCTTSVTASCVLNAAFRMDLGGGAVGIDAGATYQVAISLKVPQNLPATWPSNGIAVTNTATATSTTAATVTDGADVTVVIPVVVDTVVGKTWLPATQQFAVGAPSTITLTNQNASNTYASALTMTEPTSAVEGATAIGTDNPFRLVDYAGGSVSLPAGADLVQVDAYVSDGAGGYTWVPGSPRAPGAIVLPDTVTNADVVGLRFTYTSSTGATIEPAGTAGSVTLDVVQRADNRVTGDSLVAGGQVTNDVTGSVDVPNENSVTKTASAPFTIGPLTVSVDADKTIVPARIPAGTTARATLQATNTSNGPVDTLRVADQDFFTENLTFGGFVGGISYPDGATAAAITWYYSDGSSVGPTAVATGTTPAAPAAPGGAWLTGFVIDYTGSIPNSSQATVQFDIAPLAGFVPQPEDSPVVTENTLVASVTNSAGSATDSDPAPLSVFYPDIQITTSKSLSPGSAVSPGATVVGQLPTSTSTDSAFVKPQTIIVQDVWDASDPSNFLNAFNPIAIAPTQVLSGSTLLIEYTRDEGATWSTLTTVDATGGTQVYSGNLPAPTDTITGLRYTFTNTAGFPAGTNVSPNAVYQARSDLRDGSGPTSLPNQGPVTYTNVSDAIADGIVMGIPTPIISDEVHGTDDAQIQTNTGVGTLIADKRWTTSNYSSDLFSLSSQSGESAWTRLGWGVTSTGYSSVTIEDSSQGETTPASTVFQAFNLTAIAPITYSQDPLLRWDTVTAVELYDSSVASWTTVSAPSGGWMNGSGFAGYTLTSDQQASTTGVRLIVTPNDAARASSTDPLAPPVGSGVSTSALGSARFIGLSWQLRNDLRDKTADPTYPWVTATQEFNDPAAGTISNTVGVSGVQDGTPVGPRTASDTVILIDQPPAVDVAKTSQKSQMVVPQPGDVAPSGYPTNDFTVTAKNDSSSRASYVRVSDPMPCGPSTLGNCVTAPTDWAADPYAGKTYNDVLNPFERFTLTGIDFAVNTSQVDTAQSTVTLWHRAGDGTLSTSTLSLSAADALDAAALADVVGVSVLYQGTDPGTRGGSLVSGTEMKMTLHTQLRATLRSQPLTFVQPFTVDNYTFAQSYDPVLYPSGALSTPSDNALASIQLVKGNLGVTAAKSFSPNSVLETNRTTPITMNLTATQGNQTVAPAQVTVQDVDQDFWNEFALASFAAGDVTFPQGANRVDVGVQLDGGTDWITTGPQTTAALPTLPTGSTNANVTGIRFVYTHDGGTGLFSDTAPPRSWTTTAALKVVLRDANRATGDPIPFPSSLDNEVTTNAHRFEDPVLYPDANASAVGIVNLDPGTFRLDVRKDPQNGVHTVSAGEPNTWTMSFGNTGTGFLTVPTLVDTLPASLEWDGATPTFATTSGGTLSTTPTTTYDAASRTLTFAWPEGGQRMSPNERFTITLGIILQPGLTPTDRATNRMVVNTAQTLAACTNTSGNGQGTLSGLAATQCGTTNYVSPTPGASLLATKGVKGDVVSQTVSGGRNITNPGGPCVLLAGGYYRSPCAANTIVGGVDEWQLNVVNSGTVAYDKVTVVDALPFPGDRLLATGSARGSVYTPAFNGVLDVSVPGGATVTWEVTTAPAANVCVGTGPTSAWPSDPKCNSVTWVDHTSYTGDWADVTGLRITADFTTRSSIPRLDPGESGTITYQTVNIPATTTDADRAPVTVPVGDPIAWNQFGVTADLTGGGVFSRAPVKAGVVMTGGPLQITKAITGAGAANAPTSFQASVACTVAGAPVDMGGFGGVTLDEANSYTARIDGIPLGASCTVTEDGTDGSYGETTRTVTPSGAVAISTAATASDPVPADQQVTITNDYALTSLAVTKTVSTTATVGTFGPFGYSAACTTALGAPIALAPGDAAFSLSDGDTHTIENLPVRAECVITETDSDGATTAPNTVEVSVNGGPLTSGTVATVPLGTDANTADYTNTYPGGQLSITKTLAGDAAGDGTGSPGPDDGYGQGPFEVHVVCTYDTQTLYDDTISIVGGETVQLEPVFPAGTACSTVETTTGGANDTTVDQPTVIIPGAASGETLGAVTVDVTNTFNPGSVHLVKERAGAGAEVYGAGPFTVQVTCTWQKDGVTLTIPLEDGGVVVLDDSNDYEATISGLIQGATCTTVETVNGGATSTAFDPADPLDPAQSVVTVPDTTPADVTITNTFDVGSLAIDKQRVGDGVELFGAGPFTAQVVCTWQKDGETVPVALPDDGVVTLSADNDYFVTLDGIIAGAECVVEETDAGLATATTLDPSDGTVTVVADGDGVEPVTVTITNQFDVGELSIAKRVDKAAATVGDTLVYTITVANVGQIDATDVVVTDTPPAGLTVTSTNPQADTSVPGALTWTIPSLPVGASVDLTVTGTATQAGTVTNSATVDTPVGPWVPPTVPGTPGATTATASTVVVVPTLPGDLPNTGLPAAALLIAGTGAAMAGALLVLLFWRRRRVS
ncbi:MAG: DUF11 domain-containing protein [Herbiconiux sp.]|uniref:DUF5979 domain-containing protein n=1 Tax=Herbiconiux sp. TaxID=1871186 RepID=UPI0011FE9459|nr:DUF5979 domain-containing protein [Herbiconiux sp.]TAJ47655.1 MAG: DUF11 domain-containing protein [Herbiconiux sp.]